MPVDRSKEKRYDESNKARLLEGSQIKRIRGLYAIRSKEIMHDLGMVYGYFARYWPNEMAEELRKRSDDTHLDIADFLILEQNNPLIYFISEGDADGDYDWKGIARTIDILDAVRRKVSKRTDKPRLLESILLFLVNR